MLFSGQGKYQIRGIWKIRWPRGTKTSPSPKAPVRPRVHLPVLSCLQTLSHGHQRSDTACRPVWSNLPTNRFLITLAAQRSGNVWFFGNARKQRHAVCGEFYVQCYHLSTELSHWSLSVADKHEKAHWHLSVRCTHVFFLAVL